MSLTDEQIRSRRTRARERAHRRHARRRALLLGAAVVLAGVVVTAMALVARGGGSGAQRGAGARAQRGAGARALPRPASDRRGIPPAQPGRAQVVQQGSTASGEVALTFDDGFCAACVARIVDVLWRTGAHATFFPNGTYSSSWGPQAPRIRAMLARGQIVVGNHTFTHHDPRTESPDTFAADLARNESWIEKTFGVSGRPWFRPPYGAYDGATLGVAGQQGYTRVVLWSGTLADSRPQTIPYLLKATRDWAHPGLIILGHGNYPNTARALPRILDILRARRLRLVTVAELLGGAPTGAG